MIKTIKYKILKFWYKNIKRKTFYITCQMKYEIGEVLNINTTSITKKANLLILETKPEGKFYKSLVINKI